MQPARSAPTYLTCRREAQFAQAPPAQVGRKHSTTQPKTIPHGSAVTGCRQKHHPHEINYTILLKDFISEHKISITILYVFHSPLKFQSSYPNHWLVAPSVLQASDTSRQKHHYILDSFPKQSTISISTCLTSQMSTLTFSSSLSSATTCREYRRRPHTDCRTSMH